MKSGLFNRRLLALLALLTLLLLLPRGLSARPDGALPCPGAKQVRVSVVLILATERDEAVDPKLKCIAEEVRKLYPKLRGFRLTKISCRSLPVGTQDCFELIEDQHTTITVQCGAEKGTGRVRLKVAPPAMGEITYSTPCGKFLPIVTPYRTKGHELILIAVRVQPCKGK